MKNANILSFIEEKTKEAEDNVALGTRTSLGWAELTYKGLGILARKDKRSRRQRSIRHKN